ncbi:hypothetical protein D3C81_316250 [compost metagenome]
MQQREVAQFLRVFQAAQSVDQARAAHREEAQCNDFFNNHFRPVTNPVSDEQVGAGVVDVIRRARRDQLQLHLRVLPQERADVVTQPISSKPRCATDAQPSGDFLIVDQLPGIEQVQQNPVHLPRISLALIGQADPSANALGQSKAHAFLKLADLVTDGAAGQVQFTGRNRHAACAGNRVQRAKGGHRRKTHKSSRWKYESKGQCKTCSSWRSLRSAAQQS